MDRRLTVVGGILAGVGAGAGLMFFLDPDRGQRRRAEVRNRVTAAANDATHAYCALVGASRDARNRAYGLFAETRRRLRREEVYDAVLEARVRSRMGHKIAHPEHVQVKADHGRVTLDGRVGASEAAALVACVSSVKGVREIANQIEVY